MTLHLFVRIATGEHTDKVATALAECGPPSRAELGCREYRTFRGAQNDAVFLKEEWESQAALDEHMGTPHFQAFKAALESATGQKMDEVASLWAVRPLEA